MPIEDDELFAFDGKPIEPKTNRESNIEADGIKYAAANEWEHKKMGTNGWPDHLFLRGPPPEALFVEFKRRGKPAMENQKRRIKMLREMGFRVLLIDRREQFADAFR